MLKLNLTDDILKEMKGETAVLMGEQNLERNLDNLLRVPHSTGVYVLREGWSFCVRCVILFFRYGIFYPITH